MSEAATYRTPRKARTPRAAVAPLAERDILKAILSFLKARQILAWRVNTGAVKASYGGKSRFIRFGPAGQADIQGVLPGGKYLAIEVKAAKGVVSEAQRTFLDSVVGQGGVAGVCRSVDEARALLAESHYYPDLDNYDPDSE